MISFPMPAISEAHIERILEISGLVTECAGDAQFPPQLMQEMTRLFGSRSCVYYAMNNDFDNQPLWDGFGYNLDAARVREYESHYLMMDPCFDGLRQRGATGRPLIVSTDQVIDSERSFLASGYYRDFLYPQHILHSIIFAVGDAQGMLGLFGFHRAPGKPHYSSQEHLKARLFASHMAGALRLRKLSNDQVRLRALVHKLMREAAIRDYVVIDGDWRVIDSAGAATELLNPSGNLRIVGEPAQSVALRLPNAIRAHLAQHARRSRGGFHAQQASGNAYRVFDDIPNWPRMMVDVLDLDSGTPLYLLAFLDRNQELLCDAKLSEYAVTPREREVACKVSRGLTTQQIADQLTISEKTVENHLDHLYRKTGTHNRSALIYRLSR